MRSRVRARTVVTMLVVSSALVAAVSTVSADPVPAGRVLRVHVDDAFGGKTVIGQLTVANARDAGHVTAFGCDDGIPTGPDGGVTRSDVNYDGSVTPRWSNRLIVAADDDGDVCFHALTTVDLVVDVNAVSFDTGISSFDNRRIDTRTGATRRPGEAATLRISVSQAAGGKTVIGQLTAANATDRGHVTAYPCADGIPTGRGGRVARSDLNYDGRIKPAWSNRLIVQADDDGDICLTPHTDVDLVVDINGVADGGIASFANRRVDTRTAGARAPGAEGTMRVRVERAAGGKTVIGQLTIASADDPGHVTAYPCADGIPTRGDGDVDRSDLNYDGRIKPAWSNRLIVQADDDGDICLTPHTDVDLVVDVNGVAEPDAIFSFPNERTDTRVEAIASEPLAPPVVGGVPVWAEYEPRPALDGIAALTGGAATETVANRPIVAVKIDNYRQARPQWALDRADAVFEVEAEGISRFVALFHSDVPDTLGPVRSARTGDLDLLTAMNRPVFAYSGANPGVNAWIESAEFSGLLVNFSAQFNGCYSRRSDRPGPHNLSLDPMCAVGRSGDAGPARPLWPIDRGWEPSDAVDDAATADTTFDVDMSGVSVEWQWDPDDGVYLRSQDGEPHLADAAETAPDDPDDPDGPDDRETVRIAADTVVEVYVPYIDSVVDERSPHPITVGSGDAVIHRDGLAHPATWSRPTGYEAFTFTADDGTGIPVNQGTTWVELVRE